MAYRSVEAESFAADAPVRAAAAGGLKALLAPSEALAVALGMRDGLASLRSDNWLARSTRLLFGLGPKRPLADERLERLRRLTVRLRHQPELASGEIAAALAAGITRGQIAAIVEKIGARATAG